MRPMMVHPAGRGTSGEKRLDARRVEGVLSDRRGFFWVDRVIRPAQAAWAAQAEAAGRRREARRVDAGCPAPGVG